MRLLILLLLAAPLSAQVEQRTLVPDVNVNLPPLEITNEITVMTDSAMIANLNRNLEALRVEIAAQECNTCGGSDLVRVGQGALVLIAAFMAWQVKKIADKPNGDDVHHEGDTNVEVNVPEHERPKHDHGHDDDSES
jgi:hypothetical protein